MDGAHAAACEDMAATVSSIEGTAQNGLILCIETVMAEVYTLREFSYLNIILFWYKYTVFDACISPDG